MSTEGPAPNGPTTTTSKHLQLDLSDHVVKTSPLSKEKIDSKIAEFIYACNLPFSMVEHPLFLNLIENLRPGYKPPTRQTIGSSLLDNTHKKLQDDMEGKPEGKQVTIQQDELSDMQWRLGVDKAQKLEFCHRMLRGSKESDY